MSQLNYGSYGMGCTCPDCMNIKGSLETFSTSMAELSVKAQQASETLKSWQIVEPSLYPTYNQYQVFVPKEFYKQLVTPVNSPPVREDKPSQEEVNAKWRPWFENLTAVQRKVLAFSYPHVFTASGEFSDALPGDWWKGFEEHLKSPRNYVMYMLAQMPVLQTTVPYSCSCASSCEGRVCDVIMHMNDFHDWTFNQIADWLDTLGLDLSFPIPEEITEH